MSIVVKGVSKRFNDFPALENVSLDVETGSLTALLGPSGSGKSTLLRVIAGLEQPDQGEVVIFGDDATGVAPQKRGVGFVFQHYAAFKHMTVFDNIAFGLTIRKRPKDEIKDRVSELLELVQLKPFAHRYPAQLSGGQRQRMALARALAVEPRVLLLDEPFGALDARVRSELREWLRRLHEEVHVTTVFVTHDQEEAMQVADRIAVMNKGVIEQVGGPRDLYENPESEFVMSFIGPVNRVGDTWVRPHDLELLSYPSDGADEAMIERIVHLGFEVRIELTRADGEKMWAQVTRDRCEELELEENQIVYLRPQHERSSRRSLTQCPASTRPHCVEAPSLDEVCERGLLEHPAHTGAELDPDVLERGCRPGVGHVLRPAAADAGDRALHGADDVGEADLRRRPAEPVAAVGAAPAGDELGAAQLEQDVLEEVERNLLRGRELLTLDRLPRLRRGELRKRAQRIVHLRRDPHALIL